VAVARIPKAWTSGPEEAELRQRAIDAVEAYARHVDLRSEHLRVIARPPRIDDDEDREPFRGTWFRAGPDMYLGAPPWADAEADFDARSESDGAATDEPWVLETPVDRAARS
jgi:hypothetical protein